MENLKNIWKPECKCLMVVSIFTCEVLCNNAITHYVHIYFTVYRIQLEAPKPYRIICENCTDKPEFYGKEYHGIMGHKEATLRLENEPNGAFLIRKGNEFNDFYTLTWR